MSFFDSQNPGIGGLDELTDSEEAFLVSLVNQSYSEGDILFHDGSGFVRLPIGSSGEVLKVDTGVPVWGTGGGEGDFFADGTVPMTGDLNMGNNEITNVSRIMVDDEAYDATDWNGSLEVPTKNAVRDKVDAMDTAIGLNTAKVSYTDAAKVATIETNADVTDTANVTAAGALMDSEVTNLAQVKAFDTTDYVTPTGTETLTNKTLTDTKIETSINAQTGTTYTLVLADASKHVSMSNASANTLTVPPNSSVAFPTGTRLMVEQKGAGSTTIAAGAGVTINAPASVALEIGEQYSSRGLLKTATDTWLLI